MPQLPTTAAVIVSVPPGSETTIAKLMVNARANIRLHDLGITGGLRTKRAMTGALIPSKESVASADKLALRLHDVLSDTDAVIVYPCRAGGIRVMDLEESITQAEVTRAVAAAGG